MVKEALLTQLTDQKDAPLSGAELARRLGVSRNAVWKAAQQLKSEGVPVCSGKNGYYLQAKSDIFTGAELAHWLRGPFPWQPVFLPSVPSTNTYAKTLAAGGAPEGTVVLAAAQTAGRGRRGRPFYSPEEKGLYFSLILRPQCHVEDIPLLTALSAVSVLDGLEALTGKRPWVKWPNDILAGGKKLCGILTECALEGESGLVEYAVVGMGLNLAQGPEDFPHPLSESATSLRQTTGAIYHRCQVAAAILDAFAALYPAQLGSPALLARYREDLTLLTGPLTVTAGKEAFSATAQGVDDKGRIILLKEDGSTLHLTAGEIAQGDAEV